LDCAHVTEEDVEILDVDGRRVTEPFKFFDRQSWIGEIQVETDPAGFMSNDLRRIHSEHGEGLHHFKERISQDAIDEVLKEYKEKGIEVTQTGRSRGLPLLSKHEPKLDFVLELGNALY